MALNVSQIRHDFPALSETWRGKPVTYFDNACMTFKPRQVIDRVIEYYRSSAGCHGRANHLFGRRTTEQYDHARSVLKKFIGARHDRELLFTRNTTESINIVAQGLGLQPGDRVLCSDIEHNSNLLPWQRLVQTSGVEHVVVPTHADTTFDMDAFSRGLEGGRVKLVSVLHTSNLTGVVFPVGKICAMAHRHGALVLLDAAQAPLTSALNVRELAPDFLALSVHKMFGPTGTGVLYVRQRHLERLAPLMFGGETVLDTTYTTAELAPSPDRFEAGLQNYAGAMGAAAAAAYVNDLGQRNIKEHLFRLNVRATEGLVRLDGVELIGPEDPAKRCSIVNFVVRGISSEDLAVLLNDAAGVMVRAGKHCVHSWYNARQVPESVRVSFAPYNTPEEVEALLEHLGQILKHFV